MMPFDDILEQQYGHAEILEDYNEDEALALIELAFLTVMIDGEVTDPELEQMSHELLEVVFDCRDEAEDLLAAHGADDTRATLARHLENDESLTPFIEARAERLRGRDRREAALNVLGTLSYADGLDPRESEICHEIGRIFGFEEEAIESCLIEGAVDVWELGGERID